MKNEWQTLYFPGYIIDYAGCSTERRNGLLERAERALGALDDRQTPIERNTEMTTNRDLHTNAGYERTAELIRLIAPKTWDSAALVNSLIARKATYDEACAELLKAHTLRFGDCLSHTGGGAASKLNGMSDAEFTRAVCG